MKPEGNNIFLVSNDEWHFVFRGLLMGYYDARKNKKTTGDRIDFEINLLNNLMRLTDEICQRKYRPAAGITFVVMKPVPREVFAAPFRDRVVHHFLCNLTMEKFDVNFIETSFSCRKNKGTRYAIRKLHAQMQSISNNFSKEAYVAKFDLKGFFMSLRRDLLWEEVKYYLTEFYPKRGVEYEVVSFLWHEIIMDDPIVGVKRRGDLRLFRHIPRDKSLFYQPQGQGIVIGNLTSQLLSNIYLNKLDRFIVDTLGYEYYGRYVDDFYVLVNLEELENLKNKEKEIEYYLTGLGLKLHPKKKYLQNINKGVGFLGAAVYPHRILPGRRIMGEFGLEVKNGNNVNLERLQSYFGLMRSFKAKKMLDRAIRRIKAKCITREDLGLKN